MENQSRGERTAAWEPACAAAKVRIARDPKAPGLRRARAFLFCPCPGGTGRSFRGGLEAAGRGLGEQREARDAPWRRPSASRSRAKPRPHPPPAPFSVLEGDVCHA